MTKKKTEKKDMRDILRQILDDYHKQMNENFVTAQNQMSTAENDLADTFNEKQKELYNTYCVKRKEFYQIAEEIYERRF